jgi:transposase
MKQKEKRITIGLDLGERRHWFCALDGQGEVVEQGSVGNDRASLAQLTARYRGAVVVMEAGAHSPWISRYLEGLGLEVIVSNPRKVRAIYQHERKCDERDALMLARIGRMDPALLYPVRHCSEEAQQDLLRIKLRDSLVRARVSLINSVRFSLKSLGYSVRNPSSERFHKVVVMDTLPEAVGEDDLAKRAGAGRTECTHQSARARDRLVSSDQISPSTSAAAGARSGITDRALFCSEDRRPEAI